MSLPCSKSSYGFLSHFFKILACFSCLTRPYMIWPLPTSQTLPPVSLSFAHLMIDPRWSSSTTSRSWTLILSFQACSSPVVQMVHSLFGGLNLNVISLGRPFLAKTALATIPFLFCLQGIYHHLILDTCLLSVFSIRTSVPWGQALCLVYHSFPSTMNVIQHRVGVE